METPERGVQDLEAHAAAAWQIFRSMGSPKYHVAPMVDQSELAFRQLCRVYGATCAYSPMFHARLFVEDPKYRAEHFTTCETDRPLMVQFCANEPKTLLSAAKLVEDQCDYVDLNFGCPQRIAKRGNYGAFLMDDLPRVKALVEELYDGLKTPVSVKIRRFDETEKTIAYALMCERAGASVLAIHGRTREQKDASKVRADWDVIKAVKSALKIPVLANGNVQCLEDAEKLMAYTGVDGVLSATPLLENPRLFSGNESVGVVPCDLVLEYLDFVEKHSTPMRMVKGHVHKMLGQWFKEHWDLRDRLNIDLKLDIAKLRQIAIDLKARIVECGRDHAVPKVTPRQQARLDEEEQRQQRIQEAKDEQEREEGAVRALDTATESNGHGSNGHVSNGHVTNGHVTNGHVTNGHVSNGHSSSQNGARVDAAQLTSSTPPQGGAAASNGSGPLPSEGTIEQGPSKRIRVEGESE